MSTHDTVDAGRRRLVDAAGAAGIIALIRPGKGLAPCPSTADRVAAWAPGRQHKRRLKPSTFTNPHAGRGNPPPFAHPPQYLEIDHETL